MKAKKAIILSIVMVLLFGCFYGCGASATKGNAEMGEFRDIPFGTEYDEVKKRIREDLAEQDYNKFPERNILNYGQYAGDYCYLIYRDIALGGNSVDMTLTFFRKEKENVFVLVRGEYLYMSTEKIKKFKFDEFYEFVEKELTEKYGSDTIVDGEGRIDTTWNLGNSSIVLSDYHLKDGKRNRVMITYTADKLWDQLIEERDAAKEEAKQNSNHGL